MSKSQKYNEEDFIQAVQNSFSIRQVLLKLNLCSSGGGYTTIKNGISRLNLNTNHFKGRGWSKGLKGVQIPQYISAQEYLGTNRSINSHNLKIKLLKENYLQNICVMCGLNSEWNNKPITLELDHINGDPKDNRLENLRILCPNCHSQTPTFRSKKRKVSKLGSGLPSALSVKGSPNLIANSQEISNLVDPVTVSFNFCSCGKQISNKAKSCKNCVQKKTKISWPNVAKLRDMVWEKPRSILATELGVSDKAIAKKCQKLNIPMPPRGYWAKLSSQKQ